MSLSSRLSSRRAIAIFFGLVLPGAIAAGACTTEASDAGESTEDALTVSETAAKLFDVNDVSILFPRDAETGEPQPTIRLTDVDKTGKELVSQSIFDQVLKFAANGADGKPETNPGIGLSGDAAKRENWRVVGMRFDPCAPTTKIAGDPVLAAVGITECIVQMRLIVQPIVAKRDIDTTAHLVFNLATKSALGANFDGFVTKMVTLLRAIRDESSAAGGPTAGRTLGVHPGLAKDPARVGAKVREFIEVTAAAATQGEAVSPTGTKNIAFMGLGGSGPEPWIFFAGRVVPATGWTPITMPAFPRGKNMVQKLSFLDPARVLPKSELPLSTSVLFASPTNTPANAKTAFTIDQPEDRHFFNLDCVSCHTTSSRIVNLGITSTADRFRVPNGITGYVARENGQGATWNVRNFGYFGGKPTVALRTVNESVGVVQFLNTEWIPERADLLALNARRAKVGKPALAGPARDCTKVDDAVFDCFAKGGSSDEQAVAAKCTATCGGMATNLPDTEPENPPPPPPIDPLPTGDPCTDAVTKNITVGPSVATLDGPNAACLSRQMNGSFRSLPIDIVCTTTVGCTVTMNRRPTLSADGKTQSLNVTGLAGRRLAATLQAPIVNGFETFASRGPDAAGNALTIKCKGSDCTVAIRAK